MTTTLPTITSPDDFAGSVKNALVAYHHNPASAALDLAELESELRRARSRAFIAVMKQQIQASKADISAVIFDVEHNDEAGISCTLRAVRLAHGVTLSEFEYDETGAEFWRVDETFLSLIYDIDESDYNAGVIEF